MKGRNRADAGPAGRTALIGTGRAFGLSVFIMSGESGEASGNTRRSAARGRTAAALGIVAAGLLAFAWACGSARRGAPLVLADGDGDPRIMGGEYSFMRHCQPCHPGGDSGLAPALNNKPLLPDFLIRFQVRNGLGKMPAFPPDVLSSEELDGIVAYLNFLRSLERK